MVVSSSSNTITCVNSDNQNKILSNNTVRQIATALPKTVVRKLSRDPRLADLRTADIFPDTDAKKVSLI